MDIVIKDRNRIVNWQFPRNTTLKKALAKWEKGYHPFKRDQVRLNGRRILEAHLECKLRYFAEKADKLVFQVETVFPKKQDKEVLGNG